MLDFIPINLGVLCDQAIVIAHAFAVLVAGQTLDFFVDFQFLIDYLWGPVLIEVATNLWALSVALGI